MKFDDSLKNAMSAAMDTGVTPFLVGEPGIGKSSFVETMAEENGTRAFTLPCNQLGDKTDLTGARLIANEDGTDYSQAFFPHEVIKEAIEYALAHPDERPALFLDEINRASADITTAILTLITLRRMGRDKLPRNLILVAAGNDKGNVTSLDDASLSRFFMFHVEPDAAVLLDYLGDSCNPYVKRVLTKKPHLVFQKSLGSSQALVDGHDDDDDDDSQMASIADLADDGEEMAQLTTPRTIEYASRWLNKQSPEALQGFVQTAVSVKGRDTTMLNELLEGLLGNTEMTTFLVNEIVEALSSGDDDDDSAAGPKGPSVTRPVFWSDLKAAKNTTGADSVEQVIETLSEQERGDGLLYALYDNTADNTVVIQQLCASMERDGHGLVQDHHNKLGALGSSQALDHEAVETLFDTGTPIADNLANMLGFFGYARS